MTLANFGKNVKKFDCLNLVSSNVKWYTALENNVAHSYKSEYTILFFYNYLFILIGG